MRACLAVRVQGTVQWWGQPRACSFDEGEMAGRSSSSRMACRAIVLLQAAERAQTTPMIAPLP